MGIKDWITHEAMGLDMIQREFLMMIYRDWREDATRFAGGHEAESGMVAAGYAAIVGENVQMTAKGIKFWESYIAARGEILPGSVFAVAYGRRGYHKG